MVPYYYVSSHLAVSLYLLLMYVFRVKPSCVWWRNVESDGVSWFCWFQGNTWNSWKWFELLLCIVLSKLMQKRLISVLASWKDIWYRCHLVGYAFFFLLCCCPRRLITFFPQWTVEIAPKFHEDANNLDQLVPFEECIELHSTGEAVVRAPDYLLLTHNGRSFRLLSYPIYSD